MYSLEPRTVAHGRQRRLGNRKGGLPRHVPAILVVDDDEVLRDLLCDMIKDEDFECVGAASGREALRCLSERTFNLVVSDVVMPDVNGVELLQKIHNRWPELPVLCVSGGGIGLEAEEVLHLVDAFGARHVAAKPFHCDDFLAAIRGILRTSGRG